MADLTAKTGSRGQGAGQGGMSGVDVPAAHADATVDAAALGPTLDPRSVRARLAPGSGVGDETPVRLSPIAEPLRMTNPSVGVGPLGGTTITGEPPTPTVLAQRQFDLDGERVNLGLVGEGHDRHTLLEDGTASGVILGPDRQLDGGVRRREVLVDGFRFEVDVESERIAALRERAGRGRAASAQHGSLEIRAIIPGRVVSVSVAPGDAVTAGMQLLVVEAMKMQNELRAPRDGAVEQVAVRPGATIEVGDLLVVIS
jgi:biotin carboxyl carrier protein